MTRKRLQELRRFEGHQMGLALADGSRIDDCQLVSAGRQDLGTLWLYHNGHDMFVASASVVDVWEVRSAA
jgi:hypothetical protein